ncbi:DUF397 domain-containing protein [Acrocarpospora catenulata]|uniref:DUF397 domain-containing protein n=1 Tax=Acrocarpospora catenulata TaxID=2836182 RepID=UPI001BDA5E2B|nr:DUF397 domain-containing protein [Acrocarpospora catenulata]
MDLSALNLDSLLREADWRKATASGANQGNCIEVAPLANDLVAMRDTERPDLPPYVVRGAVFRAFIDGAKGGEFDF